MMSTMTAVPTRARDAWIARIQPNAAPSCRRVCFPYAGAGASVYRSWAAALPSNVDLVVVRAPGREGRWREKPIQDLDVMVPAVAQALCGYLTLPFVFFGHSLGALIAFEVARHLRRMRQPSPALLFVSAHRAPHLPNPHPGISALPDAEFIHRICELYDGIPQSVLDDRDLIPLMLPCLRADFSLFETYRFVEDAPLSCSITAFGGAGDRGLGEAELAGWRTQTTGAFRFQMFDGDHFFLNDKRDELLDSVKRDLMEVGLVS